MTDEPLGRPEALNELIRAYEFQYADITDLWRSLETKAQGVVGLAGIFLGVAFVIADRLRPLTCVLLVSLLTAVVCFTLAVGLAVVALVVRKLPAPPAGQDFNNLLSDYLDGDLTIERTLNLRRDYLRLWNASLDKRIRASEGKAAWLKAAQIAGLVGILAMAISTTIAMLAM